MTIDVWISLSLLSTRCLRVQQEQSKFTSSANRTNAAVWTHYRYRYCIEQWPWAQQWVLCDPTCNLSKSDLHHFIIHACAWPLISSLSSQSHVFLKKWNSASVSAVPAGMNMSSSWFCRRPAWWDMWTWSLCWIPTPSIFLRFKSLYWKTRLLGSAKSLVRTFIPFRVC